jgi:hypothetical protein
MKKNLNEGMISSMGKAALNMAKPMLKQGGKKLFRKAARAGIKKFGKNATRQLINGAKQLAQNPEVQQAAMEAGKNGINAIKNKLTLKRTTKTTQPTQKQLIENWSNIVDNALNEAWGALAKGAIAGGKALAKGAKAAGKAAKLGKGASTANMISNVGGALVDDLKDTASSAFDATPVGTVKNTFVDENGNFSFNPMRGLKKTATGALKTADNVFTGGLGQMAYDHVTGNGEETEGEQEGVEQEAQAQAQQVQPQETQQVAPQAQQAQPQQAQPAQEAAPQQAAQTQPQQPVKKVKKPVKKAVQQPVQQQPVQQQPVQQQA